MLALFLLSFFSSAFAWSGATWIGGSNNDLVFYSHYVSVFKFQFGLQLDKATGSTKAAFVIGANDNRLMNTDLNIMGVQNGKIKVISLSN